MKNIPKKVIDRKQQPPQMDRMKNINRTITFHGKRLCKIIFRCRHYVRHLGICNRILGQTVTGYGRFYSAQFGGKNEVRVLTNV